MAIISDEASDAPSLIIKANIKPRSDEYRNGASYARNTGI